MATTTNVPVEVYLRSSYEDRQLIRKDFFTLAAKNISFEMDEIRKLVDKRQLID